MYIGDRGRSCICISVIVGGRVYISVIVGGRVYVSVISTLPLFLRFV